jgi:hypothetical protein
VHLNGLVPDRLHSLNLFDGSEDEQSRTRLLATMDELNNKYGLSTLAPGDDADGVQSSAYADCVSYHSRTVLNPWF